MKKTLLGKFLIIICLIVSISLMFVACDLSGNTPDEPKNTTADTTTGTEPDATEPDATEPDGTEPDVTEPDVTEPDVTEPDVTEPDVTEPDVTEPDVTEPDVTEPDVTEPDVTEPVVTEPVVTEPVVTEPVVTEPVVTEPVVTEPVVTEPVVTEPVVTEPVVTEPVVTEPVVTEPVVTEPVVTEPVVTEPVVTEPSIDEPVVSPTVDGIIDENEYMSSKLYSGLFQFQWTGDRGATLTEYISHDEDFVYFALVYDVEIAYLEIMMNGSADVRNDWDSAARYGWFTFDGIDAAGVDATFTAYNFGNLDYIACARTEDGKTVAELMISKESMMSAYEIDTVDYFGYYARAWMTDGNEINNGTWIDNQAFEDNGWGFGNESGFAEGYGLGDWYTTQGWTLMNIVILSDETLPENPAIFCPAGDDCTNPDHANRAEIFDLADLRCFGLLPGHFVTKSALPEEPDVTEPVGSVNNPEIIEELSWYYGEVSQPKGESQGYFYTYTAPADGTLTFYFVGLPENFVGDIAIINLTSSEQKTLLADGVDNYGMEVSMDVCEGDVISISVIAVSDADGNEYPEAVLAWMGNFAYPEGSEQNPLYIEWEWDEQYINATATVIVEAGQTLYFYGSDGMILTVNGAPIELNDDGSFSITNDAAEAAEYALAIATPVGAFDNPATLELGYNSIELAADSMGYYYTWTAPATGYFSFEIYGENWFYVINNMTTYTYGDFQWSDSDPIVNPAVIFVNEGDVLQIQVNTYDPENAFSAPAGAIEFNASLVGASAEAPYLVDFTWNDDNTAATAVITVPANTTLYFGQYRIGGMFLSINGGEPTLLESAGFFAPSAFSITNDTDKDAEYTLTLTFPVGSMNNPELIEDLSWYYGEISQPEGESQGYFYSYTAPADGTITFYFVDIPENFVGDIVITNLQSYAQKTLLADGVDNYGMEVSMDVCEGDVISISVIAVCDADGNYYPAADLAWMGNFAYPEGSEQNPLYIEWEWDENYANAFANVTVEAGQTVYFSAISQMILTVDGIETEMNYDGSFSITNDTTETAEYALALATPVGAYDNPEIIEDAVNFSDSKSLAEDGAYYYLWTATEDTTLVLKVTDGANLAVDVLTYVEDSEWPISEQFVLAEPIEDENWNYIGWAIADSLTIDVVAGQQVKIQVNALTDWNTWSTPAIDYTLTIA